MRHAAVTDPLRLALLAALGACAREPCEGGTSTPILLANGSASGFERCADGTIHRASAGEMDPAIPLPTCAGDEESLACTTDADCIDHPHGACVSYDYWDYYSYDKTTACGCRYSCQTDADCDAGNVCVPAEAAPDALDYATCQPATCLVDTNCGSGECGLSEFYDGCGWDVALACRDAKVDSCRVTEACDDDFECALSPYDEAEGWSCIQAGCAIGRPLLVEDVARAAPVAPGGRWAGPAASVLVPDAELAAWWSAVAAAEHASVASFARFTLQLLALGAPADLLAEAQRAAADEVRHAQATFALASGYAGRTLGPGPLRLDDVAFPTEARAVARALVEEACVGETLGAAEARAAAEGCEDAGLREMLAGIAEDEARHAALAWRTLRWIVTELEPSLRDEVAGWFAEAVRRAETLALAGPSRPEAGVPGPAARRSLHAEVLARVVTPAVAALVR